MNIWVIGRAVPCKSNNYSGSFEYEQAKMLAERGHIVVYYAVETVLFYKKRKPVKISCYKMDGLCIYEDYFPFHPLPPIIMLRLREYRYSKLFFREEKLSGLPDIIHVHYPAMMGYRQILKYARLGVGIVATEHWTRILTKKIRPVHIRSLQNYRIYGKALISVGEQLNQRIESLTHSCDYGAELKVIPNIVPNTFYYRGVPSSDYFTFIGVGRLVSCKRFDLLIDAFCEVFLNYPKVKLMIVGDGPEKEALNSMIIERNMIDSVILTGNLPHEAIPEIIGKCNVLICSSNLETFGVPVIEAMACGRPVITTDAIGFKNYINESVGIIIKMDSKVALKEAMLKIYNDYNKYDKLSISQYALSNFSEEAVYEKLISIYSR